GRGADRGEAERRGTAVDGLEGEDGVHRPLGGVHAVPRAVGDDAVLLDADVGDVQQPVPGGGRCPPEVPRLGGPPGAGGGTREAPGGLGGRPEERRVLPGGDVRTEEEGTGGEDGSP